jgi:hypothetical protein
MYRFNFFIIVFLALILTGILPWDATAGSESPSSIEQIFQKARQDYIQKNMNSAAEQIRKGATYMEAEATKAPAKGKEALTASARELSKLADDVQKGTATSAKRLNESFARAYVALASDSHIQSTESWAKKETIKAGNNLDAATKYLERSFAWAGQRVETSTKEAIKKSKDLSLKLQNKGSVIAEEVGEGLKETGNEIEKFAKRISHK